jgi:hypothetical protein
MALFSFTDISFIDKKNTISSVNKLTENNLYNTNILRYPIDIGDTDKGHYLIIHINEQRSTKFKRVLASDLPTVLENRRTGRSISPGLPAGKLFGNAVEIIRRFPDEVPVRVPTGVGLTGVETEDVNISLVDLKRGAEKAEEQFQKYATDFTRTISRTTDTIALYMPDTINFTHNQGYTDLSLTGGTTAALEAGNSIVDLIKQGKLSFEKGQILSSLGSVVGSLSPFIARQIGDTFLGPDLGRAIFATATGTVVNPLLDLLYTSPEFRNFRFDFMFYPRSQRESIEVQKLINRLYFHQAPEVEGTGTGFFLVPPSEFDIKFYYNGKVNENIPKISTCVLTSIDVDYAPNGFAAYEVPEQIEPKIGGTGMPVAIRLSLNFKETEVITKDYYNDRAIDTTNYDYRGSVE